jgi:carboxymethylenebutenolidase
MGTMIRLRAADGFELGAYESRPAVVPRGAVVLLQEIFGVNRHIRRVADDYAARGYHVVAPALFDRVQPGIELGYDEAGISGGRETRGKVPLDETLLDVQAAIDAAALHGKVAVIGYCWGGSLAFLAATRLERLACAVGYYGGMIAAHASERTRVPTILHFGEKDASIPLADVETVRKAHPDMSIFLYPAAHGFDCDERGSYDRASAELALERTLRFIEEKLAS